MAAEETSYIEWASFIRSVQGTVKEFKFEQLEEDWAYSGEACPFRIVDDQFLWLVLPTLVSGSWPCLTMMQLRGVRTLNGQEGTIALLRNSELSLVKM